jgi:hypothetical protein
MQPSGAQTGLDQILDIGPYATGAQMDQVLDIGPYATDAQLDQVLDIGPYTTRAQTDQVPPAVEKHQAVEDSMPTSAHPDQNLAMTGTPLAGKFDWHDDISNTFPPSCYPPDPGVLLGVHGRTITKHTGGRRGTTGSSSGIGICTTTQTAKDETVYETYIARQCTFGQFSCSY